MTKVFLRMPTPQDETSKHPRDFGWRAVGRAVLLGLTLWLTGCPQDQPRLVEAVPRAKTSDWLLVDTHTHTKFSDGRASVDEVVQKAIQAGCDAMAITDHSHYKGTAGVAYLAEIELADARYPNLIVLGGMEWNIPPYGGREHVTVLLEPALAQRALADFKDRFDRKETAEEALMWLRAQMEDEDGAVLIYNHPSRADKHPDENLSDMEAWRAVNSLFVGFEGAPGHQKRVTNIGAYTKRFKTEDRWDPVAANVGGTWDTLLDRGEELDRHQPIEIDGVGEALLGDRVTGAAVEARDLA